MRWHLNGVNMKFTELHIKDTGRTWNELPVYILENPLIYYPKDIYVPKGFETDLASIPRGFRDKLPANREYAPAAVVHDYLYTNHGMYSRAQADWIFLKAMKDCGTPLKARWAMYLAVRFYGQLAWDMHMGWNPLMR